MSMFEEMAVRAMTFEDTLSLVHEFRKLVQDNKTMRRSLLRIRKSDGLPASLLQAWANNALQSLVNRQEE